MRIMSICQKLLSHPVCRGMSCCRAVFGHLCSIIGTGFMDVMHMAGASGSSFSWTLHGGWVLAHCTGEVLLCVADTPWSSHVFNQPFWCTACAGCVMGCHASITRRNWHGACTGQYWSL